MSIFITLFFQFFAAVVLAVFINLFGKASKKLGYVNLSDIQAEGFLGYNLVFRVLAPSVYIAFLSVFLYFIGVEELVKNIWLISLWYTLLSIFILLSLGRFPLINKPLYFSIQGVAVVISFLLYKISFSHGLQAILPDASNFRTELWVILLIFFYSVLNSYEPTPSKYYERKEKYIKSLYTSLSGRYKRFLQNEIKADPFLEKLFFSIMIVEVINRNSSLRFVERILHPLGLIKTTGVMQVKSDKSLSDEESMQTAQAKIKESYNKHKDTTEGNYDLARRIIEDYNGGSLYLDAVTSIYSSIDSSCPLYGQRQLPAATALDSTTQDTELLKKQIKELLTELKKTGVDISDITPD